MILYKFTQRDNEIIEANNLPKWNDYVCFLMTELRDNEIHKTKDIFKKCCIKLEIPNEFCGRNIPYFCLLWVKNFLKILGMLEIIKNGYWKITEFGLTFFVENGKFSIEKYEKARLDYFEYIKTHPVEVAETAETAETAEAIIENNFDILNSELRNNVLNKLMTLNPYDFEKFVVKLLQKMGYGEFTTVTKKSGDDGIDCIISADVFEFDRIYIQAKHWDIDSTIGTPEIQKFLGALAGQGSSKGIYITTAKFTKDAREYCNKQLNVSIKLVDGQKLADLMIKYNFGVSIVKTYEVKEVNDEFFETDIFW